MKKIMGIIWWQEGWIKKGSYKTCGKKEGRPEGGVKTRGSWCLLSYLCRKGLTFAETKGKKKPTPDIGR